MFAVTLSWEIHFSLQQKKITFETFFTTKKEKKIPKKRKERKQKLPELFFNVTAMTKYK